MRTVGIVAALAVAALLLPRLIRWLLDTLAQRRFVRAAPWPPTTQDTCVALLLARTIGEMPRRSQSPTSPAGSTAASVPAGTSVVVGVSPSAISVWDRRGRLFDQVPLGQVRGVTLERQAYGFLVLSGRNYTTGADDYPIPTGHRHEVAILGPVVRLSVPPHQNARYFVEIFHKFQDNLEVRILGALPSESPTTFDELVDKVAMSSEGLARRLRAMTDEGLTEQSGTNVSITDYGTDVLAARVAYIAEMTRKVPRPELGNRF
jgi:hypothetical protein